MEKKELEMREFIVRNLGASDKDVQRYLEVAKRMDYLLKNAKDEYDACIPEELLAVYIFLGRDLYKRAMKKYKEEVN